jgi:hypothetical protein
VNSAYLALHSGCASIVGGVVREARDGASHFKGQQCCQIQGSPGPTGQETRQGAGSEKSVHGRQQLRTLCQLPAAGEGDLVRQHLLNNGFADSSARAGCCWWWCFVVLAYRPGTQRTKGTLQRVTHAVQCTVRSCAVQRPRCSVLTARS